MKREMRAPIESKGLRQNLHRWQGAMTIRDQVVFET